MPLTVVLDTNIVVRALIHATSWSARILDSLLDARFNLASSDSILQEVAQTLRKPNVRIYTGLSDAEIGTFQIPVDSFQETSGGVYY
jgi:putative PIN family toxin of toxin-antitoxin system